MVTLKLIFVFVLVVGIFTFIYNAVLNFLTQPYEHSDTIKRLLGEK